MKTSSLSLSLVCFLRGEAWLPYQCIMNTQRSSMKSGLSSLHKCPKCELNFLSKEGMEKHSARVHEGTAADFTRYKCEKCKSDFKTKQDFKQHKLPAKSMGTCTVCQKAGESTQFVNICEFTEHRNEHEKVNSKIQNKCNECKEEFKSSILFLKHQTIKRVPCGKPGCSEILQGECKKNIHWRNHTQPNTSSFKKHTRNAIHESTKDMSVPKSFGTKKESKLTAKSETKLIQGNQNDIETQNKSKIDLTVKKPNIGIMKQEPGKTSSLHDFMADKSKEMPFSRENHLLKQEWNKSIKPDEHKKKDTFDVKKENANMEVKQSYYQRKGKESYHQNKGLKDVKHKETTVEAKPRPAETIADKTDIKEETVVAAKSNELAISRVSHEYPRMSGAVVKFHYPTLTLVQLQGLGLGEQLFLPPTQGQTSPAPPSSPPCPPPSPPCPPPSRGYDEDEMVLGA